MAWLKNRNGTWYVGWREGGRDHYESTGMNDPDKADIERRKKELFILNRERGTPDTTVAVNKAIALYNHAHAVSFVTRHIEKMSWQHLCDFSSINTVGDFTEEKITQWVEKLKAHGYSNTTISMDMRNVRKLVRWLVRRKLLRDDPFLNISIVRWDDAGRMLSEEELHSLLGEASKDFQRLLIFTLHTGVRLGQLSVLEWKHYDKATNTLVIPPQKRQEPRVIPLHPDALYSMGEPKDGGPIFDGWNRERIMSAWRYLKQRVGFKKRTRFHDLRHTCASELGKTMAAQELRDFFKWSSVSVADKYLHSDEAIIRSKVFNRKSLIKDVNDDVH